MGKSSTTTIKKWQRKWPNSWAEGGGVLLRQTKLREMKARNSPLVQHDFLSDYRHLKAQPLRREKRRGEERRGNSERVVRKESIIIQLLWLFTDNQTKTLLILALPATVYTLPSAYFSLLYPHTQKCRPYHLQRQPVILDFPGTHGQRDQLEVLADCDVCRHMHTCRKIHTEIHTITQSTRYLYNRAET